MTQQQSVLEVKCNPQLLDWLEEQQLSLALTTYQSARLILLGRTAEGRLSGFERLFDRAMGLFATPERLYLSSRYQVWQLDNVLQPGQLYNGYDKLYIPRIGYTTGDLDIHDLAVDRTGRVIFVSSLLNCLATLSHRNSCTPLWYPPFISQIINEDRCHLNGLAMVEGLPGYVTACSQSDIAEGWRSSRRNGGCVMDLQSQEIVCAGLSMPHSPRFYQEKLWLLNSGCGEFGFIDLKARQFEPVSFCPGYLRGLAFWQQFAIVGLSRPRREESAFSGLELDERLIAKNVNSHCGLAVIDLQTGEIVHWLWFEGVIRELYDIQVIPGVKQPMALGFQTNEIAKLLTLDSCLNDRFHPINSN